MSAAPSPSRRRLREAVFAAGAASVLLLAGVTSNGFEAARMRVQDGGALLAPGWAEAAAQVTRLEIAGPEGTFTIVRDEAGGWRIVERAGHPVDAATVDALDEALRSWRTIRAMTRDPGKYARLGLAPPGDAQGGTRLRALRSDGETAVDIIIGQAPDNGGLYARRAGEMRTWSVEGEAIAFGLPSDWMQLDFLNLDPRAMARAEVQPERGPAYLVQRAGRAQEMFELRQPQDWRLLTGGAANGVGQAAARLRFRDVRPASDFDGRPPAARHGAATFSGLALALDIHADGDSRWAVVSARALADDAAERAERINALAQGWAYRLSEDAHERLTRPLDRMAEPYRAEAPE